MIRLKSIRLVTIGVCAVALLGACVYYNPITGVTQSNQPSMADITTARSIPGSAAANNPTYDFLGAVIVVGRPYHPATCGTCSPVSDPASVPASRPTGSVGVTNPPTVVAPTTVVPPPPPSPPVQMQQPKMF